MTALRDISSMEELTFNYHSVTESKDEFENAICFCGQSMCAGRYVDYVGNDAFLQVVEKEHSFIARSLLLLQSCHSELTVDDRALLEQSGFRSLVIFSFQNVLSVVT